MAVREVGVNHIGEVTEMVYRYQRKMKSIFADRLTLHRTLSGEPCVVLDDDWISVVASFKQFRGTWAVPASSFDAETMTVDTGALIGETFFSVYWDKGEPVKFQMVVYASEDEQREWRRIRKTLNTPAENLYFPTAKAAFKAVDEQGFHKDMISYPASEDEELRRLLKGHRRLGKKTTNRSKIGAYSQP